MVVERSVADLVTVWTVSGVPVRVVMGSRRYRVAEDPAPIRVSVGDRVPAEWDLVLVSLQPPSERLVVTVQERLDGRWLLVELETI